jgi:hypothetical protein
MPPAARSSCCIATMSRGEVSLGLTTDENCSGCRPPSQSRSARRSRLTRSALSTRHMCKRQRHGSSRSTGLLSCGLRGVVGSSIGAAPGSAAEASPTPPAVCHQAGMRNACERTLPLLAIITPCPPSLRAGAFVRWAAGPCDVFSRVDDANCGADQSGLKASAQLYQVSGAYPGMTAR